MSTRAQGLSAQGDRWVLEVEGDAGELSTMLLVTTPEGQQEGGGVGGGPALYPGSRVNVYTGSTDSGPRRFIARVAADVRAVVITLSDGTREDLVLHGDPVIWGARVAVLVHPRQLDIHRVDLIGHDGAILSDRLDRAPHCAD